MHVVAPARACIGLPYADHSIAIGSARWSRSSAKPSNARMAMTLLCDGFCSARSSAANARFDRVFPIAAAASASA